MIENSNLAMNAINSELSDEEIFEHLAREIIGFVPEGCKWTQLFYNFGILDDDVFEQNAILHNEDQTIPLKILRIGKQSMALSLELAHRMKNNEVDPWQSLQVIIGSDGSFNIDFQYPETDTENL